LRYDPDVSVHVRALLDVLAASGCAGQPASRAATPVQRGAATPAPFNCRRRAYLP
jgi:hypothetical protein